jgi:hypothetical protein
MTTNAPATVTRPHLEKFFECVSPVRGRIVLAVDATASRQPTWDLAAQLTSEMFAARAAGGLDVQVVYYRGDECVASRWLSDLQALSAVMRRVQCVAGLTQIGRVLTHTRKEHAREKVSALVLISDACEEPKHALFGQARELGNVPVFLFQEGNDEHVADIYAEIARITGGASCQFDAGAAQRLADLLKAVAAYATGGVKALSTQRTEAAMLLLAQVRK